MERKTFSRIGLAMVLVAFATYIAYLVTPLLFALGIYDFGVLTLIVQFLYYLAAIGLLALALIGIPRVGLYPRSRMRAGDLFTFVLMGVGVMYGGAYVGTYASELVALLVDGTAEPVLNELFDSLPMWILLALTVVMAPVMEEILFRKLLLDVLRPFGEYRAAVICGVLFGVFHMNLDQFFYAAALGFLLSYVMLKTNNLLYPIFLHAVMNAVGGVVPTLLENADENTIIAANVGLFGLMIVGVVMFFVKKRRFVYAPAPYSFSRPITASVVWGNIGMILLSVVFIFKCLVALEPSWMPAWMML